MAVYAVVAVSCETEYLQWAFAPKNAAWPTRQAVLAISSESTPPAAAFEVERLLTSQVNTQTFDMCDANKANEGKFKRILREYRVLEFGLSAVVLGLAMLFSKTTVFQREISGVEVNLPDGQTVWALNPSFNAKKPPKETVPMSMLVIGGTGIPIVVNLVFNFIMPKIMSIRIIRYDTRDFLLSLLKSSSISQLLTHFMKNMTGAFRPCFYDMCGWNREVQWDGKTNLCTSEKWEAEARKSFPSGHSSYAWATLFCLTLYLLGRSRLAAENRSTCAVSGVAKSIKLFFCFAPTLVAAWVAISRTTDNWHHYADVLAGSMIGAFAAGFGYFYNYGSIFCWESAGIPFEEYHNRRQKKVQDTSLDCEQGVWTPPDYTPQSGAYTESGITSSQKS